MRRLLYSDAVVGGLSAAAAAGLRLVAATNRVTYHPREPAAVFAEGAPFIVTAWHGQMFMMPVLRPAGYVVDVLASRNYDGEIIARALTRLGLGVIRGSGAPVAKRMHEKGAVASFRGMKTALDAGHTVALTADFMKDARRQVSPGIVALARLSGRPILPVGLASSRRWRVASWDDTTLTLPFGRTVAIMGDPVWVPRDLDEDAAEATRRGVEEQLNAMLTRAYQLVDGKA